MKKTEAQFGVGTLHQLAGAALFVFLILAWWFDYRGFLHGVAMGFQIWWLWSIGHARRKNFSRHSITMNHHSPNVTNQPERGAR